MTSIEAPRNARGRRTRDALLAATREILEHDGFQALSMAAVAARAGVTRRSVYLHFASRTDLVRALFGYIAEREGLAESLRSVWQAPDAETALREWVRHLARYHPKLMAVDRAIERERSVDVDAQRHRDTVTEAQLANCRRLAQWLHEENRLAPSWTVASATDVLFGLVCTELFGRWLETCEWSVDDLDRNLWRICRAVLVRD